METPRVPQYLDMAPLLGALHPCFQGTAKYYLCRLWDGNGPPLETSYGDLQRLAEQIGAAVARQFLQQCLHRQALSRPSPSP